MGLCALAGCQRYEPQPLSSAAVDARLGEATIAGLRVPASSIRHPLLAPVELHPEAGLTTAASSIVSVPRIAQAHAALECQLHQIIEVGRSKIVLGRVVAIHVDDAFIDPAGPYVRADELHAIGRMNGMGSYVRTRDAFFQMPRIKYADWQAGKRQG